VRWCTSEAPKNAKILRELVAAEKNPEKKWVMAGFLAGALVEPASREEWDFLQSCVEGYRDQDQSYAIFLAVLALGINASPKGTQLLQSVGSPEAEIQLGKTTP